MSFLGNPRQRTVALLGLGVLLIFALLGSLIATLIFLPVVCSWVLRKGVRERRNPIFELIKSAYTSAISASP